MCSSRKWLIFSSSSPANISKSNKSSKFSCGRSNPLGSRKYFFSPFAEFAKALEASSSGENRHSDAPRRITSVVFADGSFAAMIHASLLFRQQEFSKLERVLACEVSTDDLFFAILNGYSNTMRF